MKALKMWWLRCFKIISTEKANLLGLKWIRNICGDEINHLDCRSIWIDKKCRRYRVKELTFETILNCIHPDSEVIGWHDSTMLCKKCNCIIEQYGKKIDPPCKL